MNTKCGCAFWYVRFKQTGVQFQYFNCELLHFIKISEVVTKLLYDVYDGDGDEQFKKMEISQIMENGRTLTSIVTTTLNLDTLISLLLKIKLTEFK
jgi:predicted DNA-binding ArsR family transcriptional regulator